ncbi:MAG TPA: hypothetical protein PL106_00840, partial [Flavobacteriales bacterium]|nr:hypothetical protein [Flavobacteriales bacterium]
MGRRNAQRDLIEVSQDQLVERNLIIGGLSGREDFLAPRNRFFGGALGRRLINLHLSPRSHLFLPSLNQGIDKLQESLSGIAFRNDHRPALIFQSVAISSRVLERLWFGALICILLRRQCVARKLCFQGLRSFLCITEQQIQSNLITAGHAHCATPSALGITPCAWVTSSPCGV